jgi:Predicted metal-binding integral membrane protein (DUF2182)
MVSRGAATPSTGAKERVVVVGANAAREISRRMPSDRPSEASFVGVSALLFASSATLTIVWCASMSAMGMPMPGGWTMSMVWMRMPGQTWLGAATSFLGMWIVMMVAMMLPSLVPMLRRYSTGRRQDRRDPPGPADGDDRGRRLLRCERIALWSSAGSYVNLYTSSTPTNRPRGTGTCG